MGEHEELVNEIAGELNILFCAGRDGGIPKQLPQDLAESLVTLFLSAFHDGRLDEELGVVDRTALVRKKKGNRFWEATGFHPAWEGLEIRESERSHQAILIALRGTGKEEE